ncbi:ArsR/SmtB family transcription factor [Halorarius litoreus]|jgi:DNA-binding transcriptional ArsR family regulator|uniref:ArsR/SmtB family transcription factor n=1 Tax=Halorarius litoreus TaxID=2962676 RepID=UPI0020CCBB14|nr:winged helix-turn-helix domain-containing protein [Halorarius litoreus]
MLRHSPTSADHVLGIDDEETEGVLNALSPESARQIRSALNGKPATVSELSDRTGLTPQNVSYHLGKLADADLVRTDGTRETGGKEATVYTAGRRVVVSTESPTRRRRPDLGVVGLIVGVVLAAACLHSLVEPSANGLAMVQSGFDVLSVLF